MFHLVEHVGHEFGRLLAVVKAAEMLDLVDTPKQDVELLRSATAGGSSPPTLVS